MKRHFVILTLIIIILACVAAGCSGKNTDASGAAVPEAETGALQPIKELSFYQSDSESFAANVDGQEFVVERFYLEDFQCMGATGLNGNSPRPVIAMTQRDRGGNITKLYATYSDRFRYIVFAKGSVVEVRLLRSENVYDNANYIYESRIIDFDANGKNPSYRPYK